MAVSPVLFGAAPRWKPYRFNENPFLNELTQPSGRSGVIPALRAATPVPRRAQPVAHAPAVIQNVT
jgi:hypothetical protein